MTETIALCGLAIIYFLRFSNFFNQYALFDASYCACMLFVIYARAFLTIANDNMIKEKRRTLIECALFTLCVLMFILGYFYFSNTLNFLSGAVYLWNNVIQLSIYGITLGVLIIVKFYIFELSVHYGPTYRNWQILDSILIVSMMGLDFYINETTLFRYPHLIRVSFVLFVLLALLNKHVSGSLEYYTHKGLFIKYLRTYLDKDLLYPIIIPPKRNLEADPIYSHCVILLRDSACRVLECHKIANIIKKEILKYGYNQDVAILISSQFLSNLNYNLMRRKYDNSLLPTKFVSFLQSIKRLQKEPKILKVLNSF